MENYLHRCRDLLSNLELFDQQAEIFDEMMTRDNYRGPYRLYSTRSWLRMAKRSLVEEIRAMEGDHFTYAHPGEVRERARETSRDSHYRSIVDIIMGRSY